MKLEKVLKGVNCSNMIKGKKVIIFDLDWTLIDSIGIWNEIDKEQINKLSQYQFKDYNEMLKYYGTFKAQAHGKTEGIIVKMTCYTAEFIGEIKPSLGIQEIRWLNYKDIDFCINTISGRYPEKGYCTNEKCKEICYILEGKGTLNKKGESINFEQGDVILIEKEEIYYWNGKCKITMICTPAWYKEQCKLLEL